MLFLLWVDGGRLCYLFLIVNKSIRIGNVTEKHKLKNVNKAKIKTKRDKQMIWFINSTKTVYNTKYVSLEN